MKKKIKSKDEMESIHTIGSLTACSIFIILLVLIGLFGGDIINALIPISR